MAAEITAVSREELQPGTPVTLRIRATLDRLFPAGRVKRVLFVAPPDGDADMFSVATCRQGRYPNYPPYGAGSMAAHLRADGVECTILNLNAKVLEACRGAPADDDFDYLGTVQAALLEALEQFEPDFIGVTCMFSQTHRSAVDVCRLIKALAPGLPLAIGGVHVTNGMMDANTRDRLIAGFAMVDLIFLYECEIALRDFLRVVDGRAPAEDLAQVMFNGSGEILHVTTMRRPEGPALDTIPAHDLMPPTDLVRHGRIGTFHGLVPDGTPHATVLSNRGCRAQCTFCSVRHFNGVGVRGRSVNSVIDELRLLKETYGVGHVMWLDDDFLYDTDRAMQLFDAMIRADLGMTWDCSNGVLAHSCTDEVLAAAEASGCIGLNIGMESGNPDILKRIRKPAGVKTLLAAAENLHRVPRINARIFLMIGFPGETFGMVRDTIDVATRMDLDWSFAAPLQPLPNTPIFGQMISDGMISTSDFDQIRYTLGAYGKYRKQAEKARGVMAAPFIDAFDGVDLDALPSPEELTRVWSYMNYYLNFDRLRREQRPEKLKQAHRFLGYIADVIAPSDAFAHYYRGLVHARLTGQSDPVSVQRLQAVMDEAPYWRDRLAEVGLSPADIDAARPH